MINTIHRLSVFIHENCHSIHLCASKDKEPTLSDLMKKVERLTQDQDINDYQLQTLDSNTVLLNDQTLRSILKSSTVDQQKLELVLCHKSKATDVDDHNTHDESAYVPVNKPKGSLLFSQRDNVPVIKPTVLRWTPAILPTCNSTNSLPISHVRRYSSGFQNMKGDYGISSSNEEEPYRKKQRVMSADHPRKLPDPSTSPLPSLRNSISLDHSLHPLEIRRPSTAPLPSPPPISPYSRGTRPGPTLPAISSITSPMDNCSNPPMDSQLAPIIHLHKPFYPGNNENNNNNSGKRMRSSVASTSFAHNMQQNNANMIHLCEHITSQGKICGQTFRRSYDLSRHQTIHLENRPFCYCNKCGKKFTRMDALRRHERVQGHSSPKNRSMSTSVLPKAAVTNI